MVRRVKQPVVRKLLLGFLVGKKSAGEVLRLRQQLGGERALRDSRIKKICFWVSSLFFIALFCILFHYKRKVWFTNFYGTLDVSLTYVLAGLAGLLAGLVIGVGLVASILISYAHFIDMKLAHLKEGPARPKDSLSKEEWDKTWNEYELHIELYKYYLDMGLKANLFFYFITGGILGLYLQNPARRLMKFSLLLPILMSLAFGGVFIHGALLWMRLSDIIRSIRRDLKFKKAPDINILSLLLVVFGLIFLVIGVSIIFLAVFT